MIITRTPFRISFFGGGTDIPAWFTQEGGQVLSTAIDKYCYVTARDLPPFFDHSIRLAYSAIETVRDPADIRHPLLRVILEDFARNHIEVHYDADLPGNSGLGTSSSFGVGLVAALLGLEGRLPSKKELADRVIYYERYALQEHGGYQDQVAAAYGGFNHIVFHPDGDYSVHPIPLHAERLREFHDSLLLCYIPIKRYSGDVSLANNFRKEKCGEHLRFMHDSVRDALAILQNGSLKDIGHLMHEVWLHKRCFSGVTKPEIDDIYAAGRAAGALGGKLLGAGGGGFMLFHCRREKQARLRKALSRLLFVPFDFDFEGQKIIYYETAKGAMSAYQARRAERRPVLT